MIVVKQINRKICLKIEGLRFRTITLATSSLWPNNSIFKLWCGGSLCVFIHHLKFYNRTFNCRLDPHEIVGQDLPLSLRMFTGYVFRSWQVGDHSTQTDPQFANFWVCPQIGDIVFHLNSRNFFRFCSKCVYETW